MTLANSSAGMPPITPVVRIAIALSTSMLLGALVGCSEARSDTPTRPSRPLAGIQVEAIAAAEERPGCRREFPIEFRGISCAGHDYDPPPIPFGELYPPR